MIRISKVLKESEQHLQEAGIATARLDALILLEDVTGMDRAMILANPNYELSAQKYAKLKNLLNKRARHVPLAYIRGRAEFYGRTFLIRSKVLVPRPESEAMIDELKIIAKSITRPIIADIGTGSGALGITAKLEVPEATVWLLDIDKDCLKTAKMNVDLFTMPIEVVRSDLLASFKPETDILLCNLPYVPDDFKINRAAAHEPRLAIYGGKDGLDIYRKLFKQLQKRSQQPLYILSESLPPQHTELKRIAGLSNYQEVKKNDFIQVFKRAQN